MALSVFRFANDQRTLGLAFQAACYGTDPYAPGKRSRYVLASVLSAAIDVEAFKAAVEQGGAVLTGLPRDPDLPLTPKDGRRSPDKQTFVSEGLLNAVSKVLDMEPVAYHNEKEGSLIHQIVPIPGREMSISNQGAGVFLMHTEATHTAMPPHVLALCCVRNTEMGATNFASLDLAMRGAPPEIVAALRREDFTQAMGVSSGGGGRYRLAILNGTDDAPIYRVDFTDVEACSAEGTAALRWFKKRAQSCEEVVTLQPGDMVVLNNHRSLHGRVGFVPDFRHGQHRWLQRQYMTRFPFSGKPYDDRYPHVWHGDG